MIHLSFFSFLFEKRKKCSYRKSKHKHKIYALCTTWNTAIFSFFRPLWKNRCIIVLSWDRHCKVALSILLTIVTQFLDLVHQFGLITSNRINSCQRAHSLSRIWSNWKACQGRFWNVVHYPISSPFWQPIKLYSVWIGTGYEEMRPWCVSDEMGINSWDGSKRLNLFVSTFGDSLYICWVVLRRTSSKMVPFDIWIRFCSNQ